MNWFPKRWFGQWFGRWFGGVRGPQPSNITDHITGAMLDLDIVGDATSPSLTGIVLTYEIVGDATSPVLVGSDSNDLIIVGSLED